MLPSNLFPLLVTPILAGICVVVGWFLSGRLPKIAFHSPLEHLWLYLLLGLITLSWLGTILAAVGAFHFVPLAICGIVLVIYMRWPWRTKTVDIVPSSGVPSRTPWPVLIVLAIILAGASWIYAKPTESLLLTDDSAAYTIGGISLAQKGSLWVNPQVDWSGWVPGVTHINVWDPIQESFDELLNLPQDFIRQFFTEGIVFARHYGPFYQWSLTSPALEIGFLALPKVWIALVVRLFGAGFAPYAAPFMGVIGLLAVYMVIRRTLGWPSAILGAVLLAASLPQLLFARWSLSEIYTQVLFFGGVYLLVLVRQNLTRAKTAQSLAIWSGLALGAITILRFEALVMLLPLAVIMLLASDTSGWERGGPYRSWLLVLAGASLLGTIISAATTPYYVFTRLMTALTPGLVRRLLVVISILLVIGLVIWKYRQRAFTYFDATICFIRKYLVYIVFAIFTSWAAFALWKILTRSMGSSLAGWLLQYLSWPGLALAVVGICALLFMAHKWSVTFELVAVLILTVLFVWLYSINPRVTTLHPWAVRRLIPLVIPALVIGMSAIPWVANRLLALLPEQRRKFSLGLLVILSLVGFTGLGWELLQAGVPFLMFQDRVGLYTQLNKFASGLPAKSLLLFNDSDESQRLTQVMDLVFNRPALVIHNTSDSSATLPLVDKTVTNALQAGYRVFYIEAGQDPEPWQPRKWTIKPYASESLLTKTIQQIWGRPPNAADIVQNTIILEVFEILPGGQALLDGGQILSLPASDGSLSYLVDGFNQLETDSQGRVFRWTNGDGQLHIPWPAGNEGQVSLCIHLQVSGGRPAGQPPAHLQVFVEGKLAAESDLSSDFQIENIPISVADVTNTNDPALEIELRSTTFNVKDSTEASTSRTLGVLFYDLTMQSGVCR
ncbi:MAG: hypothetical protein ACYC6L_07225 [Anaerolineae bacterium]